MDKLILTLDEYFGKKAPALPAKAKEFIVKVSPYLAIIGAIFFVVALLPMITFLISGYGMLSALGAYVPTTSVYLNLAISVVVVLMYLIAIPGLFKRTKGAWNLMFYATLVSALGSLVTYNILGLIIGLLIGFYILFQVKSYYIN